IAIASKRKIQLQFAAEGQISDLIFCLSRRDAKRYNYLLGYSKRYLGSGRPIEFLLGWPYTQALTYAARKDWNIQVSQPKAKNTSTEQPAPCGICPSDICWPRWHNAIHRAQSTAYPKAYPN